MEFSLQVGDMSFFVISKFEIVIFKNVQVMTENIHFAFLYVLSIVYQLKQIETDPKMTTGKSEFEMLRTFRNKLKQGQRKGENSRPYIFCFETLKHIDKKILHHSAFVIFYD